MASFRKVRAPACWASALVNNDRSGLDDREIALLEEWLRRELEPDEEVVDCVGEPHFTWAFDFYGGGYAGGDVIDYTILKRP